MTFGEKLKLLRQRSGLSQTELADALCVSRAAVAKWENENGLPELTNAKTVASFFQVDLDRLLDDTLELDETGEAPVNPLTFCGNDCEACSNRETLKCPGCKNGPAKLYSGDCPVAGCCRAHDLSGCGQCSLKATCNTFSTKDQQPFNRIKKMEASRIRAAVMCRQIPLFGPVLSILFWVFIVNIALNFLFSAVSKAGGPEILKNISDIVCGVVCACLIYRLKSEDIRFRLAALGLVLACALNLLMIVISLLVSNPWFLLLISICSIFLSNMAYFKLYQGLADVMGLYDPEISNTWLTLCKLRLWGVGCMIGGLVLVGIFPLLGGLATLGGSVVSVVESIWMLITLYRSAKCFSGRYIP